MLPATHWASLVVFAILVPALVILWGMPDRTADAWAWTIQPDLTPIFLGAGYGAGAYFFLRTFLVGQVPPVGRGDLRRGLLRDAHADRDADPLGQASTTATRR